MAAPRSGARTIGSDKEKSPRAHPQVVVFTLGARAGKELPFVMGIMADLSGNPKKGKELPPVAKREFLEIHSGNFDDSLREANPRVAFPVKSVIPGVEGDLMVDLEFKNMDDFLPDRVARNVAPLAKLLAERDRLKNLAADLDGNEDGVTAVEELLRKAKDSTHKPE
jgi:type VI secretion system protein ImpB